MPDREKVIKGLEACSDVYYGADGACSSCPYSQTNGDRCLAELVHDAIALLKEQEPVKPVQHLVYTTKGWFCGACDGRLNRLGKYCSFCGREVKWDG